MYLRFIEDVLRCDRMAEDWRRDSGYGCKSFGVADEVIRRGGAFGVGAGVEAT